MQKWFSKRADLPKKVKLINYKKNMKGKGINKSQIFRRSEKTTVQNAV